LSFLGLSGSVYQNDHMEIKTAWPCKHRLKS